MADIEKRCGLCQSTSRIAFSLPFKNLFRADFYICPGCDALFLFPLPEEKVLHIAYASEYYGEDSERKFHPLIERAIDRFRRGRARRIMAYLEPGNRVLDIGCGNGYFLSSVRDLGGLIEGVELPGPAAERAKRRAELRLHEGDFLRLQLNKSGYEAVTMWHVFEHLPQPREVVQRISELLAPQGILGVSFPNSESFQAKVFGAAWFHLDPPRHLFLPSARGFESLLAKEGFILLEVRHFSLEQNIFGVLQSMLNACGFKRDALFEMLKGRPLADIGVSPRGAVMQLLSAFLLLPFSLFWAIVEAILKRGGTVEYVFRKNFSSGVNHAQR